LGVGGIVSGKKMIFNFYKAQLYCSLYIILIKGLRAETLKSKMKVRLS